MIYTTAIGMFGKGRQWRVVGNGRHQGMYLHLVRVVTITYRPTCTWIWVLQSLFKTRERRTEGVWKLDKDLVHGEDPLLPQVGLAGRHQRQHIIGQVPDNGRGREKGTLKIKERDIGYLQIKKGTCS